MARIRINNLASEFSFKNLDVEITDPPIDQDRRNAAYDDSNASDAQVMKEWAEEHLWPIVREQPQEEDGYRDVLVIFLDDDPTGEFESEFYFTPTGRLAI